MIASFECGRRFVLKVVCYVISMCLVFLPKAFCIEERCPSPQMPNDIMKCLQVRHPEVISDIMINEVSERLVDQGKAWKNPDISLETVGGRDSGSAIYESEVRLSQTIEFNSQRSARVKQGKAISEVFRSEGLGKIEEITLFGVESLYRLLQLKTEIQALQESLFTFKTILSQYQKQPMLNPEQEVTLGIILLAISEFEIRLNQYKSEREEIFSELSSNTNLSKNEIEANLPKQIVSWPDMQDKNPLIKSASLQKLGAELDLSKAALDLARTQNWSEFTVNLIAQNNVEGTSHYQLYGAGITVPLSIFQSNLGEKQLRLIEYQKAGNLLKASTIKHEYQHQNALLAYEDAVRNLRNTPSESLVEQKHKKAERLFYQGLISGPLIIETHKQLFDYVQTKNQEEMRAVKSLWKLYVLKGIFLEKTIQ